jgi:putative membrane protein (TIGR04086 family)
MPAFKAELNRPSLNLSAVARGTLAAVIVTILGSAALGLVYYFTGLPEGTLPWVATGVFILGVFVGGGLAAQIAGSRGLFHGLAVAVSFFIISWLITGLLLPAPVLFPGILSKFLLCVMSGALGGILGVSMAE